MHTKGAGIDLYEDDYKPVIDSASCPHCDFTTSVQSLFKTHMNEFYPGEPIIWPEREKQPDVSSCIRFIKTKIEIKVTWFQIKKKIRKMSILVHVPGKL